MIPSPSEKVYEWQKIPSFSEKVYEWQKIPSLPQKKCRNGKGSLYLRKSV